MPRSKLLAENLRYLQMRCCLGKFVCNLIKFIANRRAFHSHTKFCEHTCTVPSIRAQKSGLWAAVRALFTSIGSSKAAYQAIFTASVTITSFLRPKWHWCRRNNNDPQRKDMTATGHFHRKVSTQHFHRKVSTQHFPPKLYRDQTER